MRLRSIVFVAARAAAAFAVGMLLLNLLVGGYVRILASVFDATADLWAPPGVFLSRVTSEGTELLLYYVPPEAWTEAHGGTPAESFFRYDFAAFGTWDFVVVATL